MRQTFLFAVLAVAGVAGALRPDASNVLHADQLPSSPVYAIRGAKIVTAAGATIDKGNLVMRNGLIADVSATAAIPDDAIVVDGTGMTVYPGLIDMGNTAAVESTAPATGARGAAPAPVAGGGGRAGGAAAGPTWADGDRAKREALLNADFEAARHVRVDGPEMQRYAMAGITSLLAVPTDGLIKGQSALINTTAGEEAMQVSAVGGDRRGDVIVRAPVAQHIALSGGRGGGAGYPAAMLGQIAFVRQAFYDAQWQKDARAWAGTHKDQPLPSFEPVLDALAPALNGTMPVSFEAGELREILRALNMAKEFKLDPIITGGIEAAAAVADLQAAKARVILTLGAGAGGGRGGAGGGGGRGGAGTSARVTEMQQNAPKAAAALEKAGIAYAFSSAGLQNPTDLVRGVARAIREGGLTADQAIRALTVNAARMAGAADRLGSLEKGKIANVIVTDGDLFADATRVRRVFIDGREVR
ncbi:MAG: amidohydrolase family protein [Acidobacteria bacterium]|nr:amidohydrolase family protein [Acidobacteriota bacterium]